MIKLLLILAIAVVYTVIQYPSSELAELPKQAVAAAEVAQKASAGEQAITAAFDGRLSKVPVAAAGKVVRILPDDQQGSPHQRFILVLAGGMSVLVAHNIALAPRIPDLKVGDEVAFSGEYEWDSKGGLVHWTHHDPQGHHAAGWLRHHGKTYQ